MQKFIAQIEGAREPGFAAVSERSSYFCSSKLSLTNGIGKLMFGRSNRRRNYETAEVWERR